MRRVEFVRFALRRWALPIAFASLLASATSRAETPPAATRPTEEEVDRGRDARTAATIALGEGAFDRAATLLAQANTLARHQSDPELHYLRSEVLFALERDDEADNELRIAEHEIGPAPTERMPKLWLGRIYARRGELQRADLIYETLWPSPPAVDAEVAICQAESHLLRHDWLGGRQVLERLLARDPHNVRAREVLAWALEASGDLDHELSLRSGLAAERPTITSFLAWARALERAGDFRGARDLYESAITAEAGQRDDTLAISLARVRYRTTPEVSASVIARRDPQADALRLQAGVAVPFGSRQVASLVGWHETSSGQVLRGGTLVNGGGASTGVRAGLILGTSQGAWWLVAGDLGQISAASRAPATDASVDRLRLGASSELTLPLLGHAEVHLRGELNQPWNDAAVTVSEGGSTNSAGGEVFAYPTSRRMILVLAGQWRQFRLTPGVAQEDPVSTQRNLIGGADLVLWSNPEQLLRVEALDDRMVSRSSFSDAAILSYRHQEMWGDSTSDFLSRIVLAPRARVDLATATVRKVLAAQQAGLELRGGFGYDNARSATLYSVGAVATVALSWSTKLLVNYELVKETTTGFTGTRQTGWVAFHADL
jgi:hypothetical protein